MTADQLDSVLPLATQAPWVVVAWLVYQLARRALRDLCGTVPEVLAVSRQLADAIDRIADTGIRVDHYQHRTTNNDDNDTGEDGP